MYRHEKSPRAGALRRPGFTLIELLVVISIIAVLATLTSAVVLKFMAAQPVSNTNVALKKMYVLMHKRWVEVTESARKETIQGQYLVAVQTLAPSDPTTQRLIYIKIRQKQAFPETFFEAVNPIYIQTGPNQFIKIDAVPGYVQFLSKFGITPVMPSNPPLSPPASYAAYESGVCLLMALKRSVSGGTVSDQDLGLTTSVNITLAPQGAPCLVDGWGKPVNFCRWPLGCTSDSNIKAADPSDPQGLLNNANWLASQGATMFDASIHAVNTPARLKAKLPSSGQLTPVLASAGQDNIFGLLLTNPGTINQWATSPVANSDVNDNIYSDNLP